MAIDDPPIKALKEHYDLEERLSGSSLTNRVLEVVSAVPLPFPFDKIVDVLKARSVADELEKMRLLVDSVELEINGHAEELKRMNASIADCERRTDPETMTALFVDAAKKAETTRAEDRVRRIACIFTNAAYEVGPTDADEIEEMMRVGTELSNRDVEFLAELVRIEGGIVRNQGRIERYSAHTIWEHGKWGARLDPELDSVFSKLESYGLVTRLAPPNNLNIMADVQNRYALLPKGLRFADLIKSRAAAM